MHLYFSEYKNVRVLHPPVHVVSTPFSFYKWSPTIDGLYEA